jgi:ribosomal protein L7/L12
MKMRPRSELAIECRARLARGDNEEDLMRFLRAEGANKIDGIAVLREVLNLSLGEAKALIHLSRAWGDVRERDDAFHEAFEKAVTSEFGPARRTD